MITHLKLGALMDISKNEHPVITIEAGGRLDKEAHENAWKGLHAFFTKERLFQQTQGAIHLDILREPVRIELKQGVSLSYAETRNEEFDVTLIKDIEYLNFQSITADQVIGWVNRGGLENFVVNASQQQTSIDEWLQIKNNKLYPASKVRFFMITNSPVIAIDDCLFYAVKDKPLEQA